MKALFSGPALVSYALPMEPGQWFLAMQVQGDLAELAQLVKDGKPVQLVVSPKAAPEPASRPRARNLAMSAGMLCRDRTFVRWLATTFPGRWKSLGGPERDDADKAAMVVRSVCGVASRAELDSDERAAAEFHRLIRKPFNEWLVANAGTLEETP